jgi:hypothetical protein
MQVDISPETIVGTDPVSLPVESITADHFEAAAQFTVFVFHIH